MKPGRQQDADVEGQLREANEDADAEALRRLSRGEISAMAPIYDRHHVAVYKFVARITGNGSDAEDVVHATFLTAAKRAGTFDGRASCRPWLLGIAARLVQRRRRSMARFGRMLVDLAMNLRGAQVADPTELLAARDQLTRVERAFDQLSEAKRAVLLLAEIEGMSCEQIALALEIPIGTVWTRLHHARRQLANTLHKTELP
jgi:RNA polymerase sigma-70 factor (ECF subfamily)